MVTWASAAALADGVHEGAHAIIVDVALAGAVDGRLLAVQVRVQAQLRQLQHACSSAHSHHSDDHTLGLETRVLRPDDSSSHHLQSTAGRCGRQQQRQVYESEEVAGASMADATQTEVLSNAPMCKKQMDTSLTADHVLKHAA